MKKILFSLCLLACAKPNIKHRTYCANDCLHENFCDTVCQKDTECNPKDNWKECFDSCLSTMDKKPLNKEDHLGISGIERMIANLSCQEFSKFSQH